MTGPQDPATAGGERLRAGHADREQVIETLKDAFVAGRLTRDELDARARRALAARTYADLAALTADIPPAAAVPPAAGLASRPAPARSWPLARAAAKSGGCLVFAFAAVLFAANVLDPDGLGNPYHPWSSLCGFAALVAVAAAVVFLGNGGGHLSGAATPAQAAAAPAAAGRPRPGRRTARRHRPWPGSPRHPHRPEPR